jgi:hypothetical protein
MNGRKLFESFSIDASRRDLDADEVDVADPREIEGRAAAAMATESSNASISGNALPPPFNGDNEADCARSKPYSYVLVWRGNPVTVEAVGLKTESPNEELSMTCGACPNTFIGNWLSLRARSRRMFFWRDTKSARFSCSASFCVSDGAGRAPLRNCRRIIAKPRQPPLGPGASSPRCGGGRGVRGGRGGSISVRIDREMREARRIRVCSMVALDERVELELQVAHATGLKQVPKRYNGELVGVVGRVARTRVEEQIERAPLVAVQALADGGRGRKEHTLACGERGQIVPLLGPRGERGRRRRRQPVDLDLGPCLGHDNDLPVGTR